MAAGFETIFPLNSFDNAVNSKLRNSTGFFSSGNVAFVIVVCASYASAAAALIYTRRPLPAWEIAVLIAAGVAYLIVGTYGFAICRRSGSLIHGIVYFVVQLLLASVLIRLRGSAGELSLILLPLAGQSALLLPFPAMIPLCVLIYVTLVMPLILRSRWVDAIALALVYGTGIVFVVVFTRVAASEREARTALAEANQRLRDHASEVEELATTKERNRLAREIHDSLGHYLTVVNVQIGAARAVLDQDQPRALDHLSKAQALTQEGLGEVRRSVATLRATPSESRPLPEALANLVAQWNAAGLRTKLEITGTTRALGPQANLTLYRAAQEALTNAGKHAHANSVGVYLEYRNKLIHLTVTDDGVGSTNSEGGFGLLGVRERVQLLNGEVCVRTASGKGFSLEVDLPA
jgi:signal transduction histidine kinase